jgi:benzoyl-CoA reductase/2-hydroxyglutaryl-CoA dehydratase subunit BcrC/BadD/HgdB
VEQISWFCTYTPLEILDAAGWFPVRHFGNPELVEAADEMLHPAICPYARACLAEEMRAEGGHHAFFVNSCDAMRRLYDAWKASFPDAFVYLMDLPRNQNDLGRKFLAGEFAHLIEVLEGISKSPISPGAINATARKREAARISYLEQARGKSGRERLQTAMRFQGLPEEAGPETGGNGRGHPVVLTGNLLNPSGIISALDRAGARVVWMDLCNGDRAFASSTYVEEEADLARLLDSLAGLYLEKHPCARMRDEGRHYQLLVDRVHSEGAGAVIYASLKFCDSYLYDFPLLEKRLRQEGIPLLKLESDYGDGHVGQLLTRIEAFLEMV